MHDYIPDMKMQPVQVASVKMTERKLFFFSKNRSGTKKSGSTVRCEMIYINHIPKHFQSDAGVSNRTAKNRRNIGVLTSFSTISK